MSFWKEKKTIYDSSRLQIKVNDLNNLPEEKERINYCHLLVGSLEHVHRSPREREMRREKGRAARGPAPRPPRRAARAVAAGHELPVFIFFAPTWVKTTSFWPKYFVFFFTGLSWLCWKFGRWKTNRWASIRWPNG